MRRVELLLFVLSLCIIWLIVHLVWNVTEEPEGEVAKIVAPLRTESGPPPPPPPPPDRHAQLERIRNSPRLTSSSAQLLLTMMREDDAEVTSGAVEVLKQHVGQGIVVYGDADSAERAASVTAALHYAKAYAALLPHTDPGIRRDLLHSLESMGVPAAKPLGEALQRGTAAERAEMVNEVGRSQALIEALTSVWVKLVADPDPDVQERACELAGFTESTDPAVARALVKVIGAPGNNIRRARRALARLPGGVGIVIPELRKILTTGEVENRGAAAQTLSRGGAAGRAATPDLMRLAREDEAPLVRAACFHALASVAERNAALSTTLRQGVEDPDASTWQAAIWAIGSLGPEGVPLLSRCLLHERPEVAERAAWRLRDMDPDEVIGDGTDLEANLFKVLERGVAFWAVLRLLDHQQVGAEKLLPHVEGKLQASDVGERRRALEFLAGMGPQGAPLLEAVAAMRSDPDEVLRADLPYTAAVIAPADARTLALCRALAGDSQRRVRSGVTRGLELIESLPVELLAELLGVAQSQEAWRGQMDPAAEDLLDQFDAAAAIAELRRLESEGSLSAERLETAKRWIKLLNDR